MMSNVYAQDFLVTWATLRTCTPRWTCITKMVLLKLSYSIVQVFVDHFTQIYGILILNLFKPVYLSEDKILLKVDFLYNSIKENIL